MQIFDVGDRSVCMVKRGQTSTPLQALVLLNDPQFIEASYILAENIIAKAGEENTEKQLQQVFQVSTGRLPRKDEMDVLRSFLKDELNRFTLNEKDAVAYLNTGETKIKITSDPVQVAALATVVNGIMNTYEGYTIR